MRTSRFLGIFLLSLALPAWLSAQSTGLIVGMVEDGSGAMVPGANVKAINERTGLEWSTVSDEAGRFSFG